MKIAYEPHPVSPERKAELRGQGMKIIDARFAPEDQKPKEEPKADLKRGDRFDAMSEGELRAYLEEAEVEADGRWGEARLRKEARKVAAD